MFSLVVVYLVLLVLGEGGRVAQADTRQGSLTTYYYRLSALSPAISRNSRTASTGSTRTGEPFPPRPCGTDFVGCRKRWQAIEDAGGDINHPVE